MFSFVFPMDTNRLEQFKVTKQSYDEMDFPKEFVIPTRSIKEVRKYLKDNNLDKDVRLIPYEWTEGFNPAKGLNIGVEKALSDNIIITSPEVRPSTDVMEQLTKLIGKNVICEVSDEDADGNLSILVGDNYRSDTPAMYFLALFNKADIYKINGWDEDFMYGYAYEDNDFGDRWVRAGLPFEFHPEIKAVHQYHKRGETIPSGLQINQEVHQRNNQNGTTYCKNGIIKPTG